MTFRLIHTHLTSFYSSCLRKARYTKFAEMRGGRLEKNVIPEVQSLSGFVHDGYTILQLNMHSKV